MLCTLCSSDIITEPRVMSYGGLFDKNLKYRRGQSVKYFFVGQNPWRNPQRHKELLIDRAFGDKSEQILIEYLNLAQIDFASIWITNVVHNNPTLVNYAFRQCSELFKKELNLIQPKYIVALGNTSYDLIMSLMLIQHKILKILHPNALSYNFKYKDLFLKQLLELKELQ